jgi:hypothetical protein
MRDRKLSIDIAFQLIKADSNGTDHNQKRQRAEKIRIGSLTLDIGLQAFLLGDSVYCWPCFFASQYCSAFVCVLGCDWVMVAARVLPRRLL